MGVGTCARGRFRSGEGTTFSSRCDRLIGYSMGRLLTREWEDLLRVSRRTKEITGPTAWSRPVGRIGLGRSAGAMGPVRATGELQDHGAVDQAVEEGRRQRRIAEVIGPRPEVDVR